jgi:hypothetical protein
MVPENRISLHVLFVRFPQPHLPTVLDGVEVGTIGLLEDALLDIVQVIADTLEQRFTGLSGTPQLDELVLASLPHRSQHLHVGGLTAAIIHEELGHGPDL